ncbi:unnamed protein product [Echinostoma caproni]|uniref:Conserved plasma membrane protein n=1 Tax=Echinostoma caproni TaxID=27848 RepID=A0A183AXL0_9TREM|nr:unnamed protein product [Echinostoma caproni]
MDFLTVIIGYIGLCLTVIFLYQFHDSPTLRPVMRLCTICTGLLKRFIPAHLRELVEHVILWFLFERHCLYQVLYAILVLVGHAVLITDVIAQLYRFSVVENHLFIGLASLFCNGLCYVLVCLTDPGVINAQNLPVYAHVYPYDGELYTEKQCTKCLHQMPARSKHCGKSSTEMRSLLLTPEAKPSNCRY